MKNPVTVCPARRSTLQRLALLPLGGLFPLLASGDASVLNALPRIALVVGNGRYQALPALRNPINDANALAAKLREFGFTVILELDSGKDRMETVIADYGARIARQSCVGLFYYAGHAMQVSWRNYLIPVDAKIETADEAPRRTVDLASVIDGIRRARNPMNVVILDACRDNPFAEELKSGKGLSQMDAPVGTLLAYATAPGNTASDGEGTNGLYTEHLLREIGAAEAKIEDVFKRVRLNVRRVSQGRQVPWESTSLEDDFYFIPPAQIRKASQQELDRLYAQELELWKKVEVKVAAAQRSLEQGAK